MDAAEILSRCRQGAVVPVDKPAGMTSFDVIRRLRRITGVRKIGHAGTLDPMATGLLLCCFGSATRQAGALTGLSKEYSGTMRLGGETDSCDADTAVTKTLPWEHVRDEELSSCCRLFTGEIEQIPPIFSAIKVKGERLYKKARRGETVDIPARRVFIEELRVTGRRGPDVDFQVRCSKGTYVRSLARDLGRRLGCGAHLVALRRLAIGDWSVKDAVGLDELAEAASEKGKT